MKLFTSRRSSLLSCSAALCLLTGCGISNLKLNNTKTPDLPLPYTYSYDNDAQADLNAVVGSGGDLFAVGDYGEMLVSRDGGITWSGSDINGTGFLSVCEFGDHKVFATGRSGSVLLSIDGGHSWLASGPRTTSGLFSCYSDGEAIYTGGENGVMFRSDDMGKSWTPLPSPNPHTTVRTITYSSKDGFLVLGTESGEIFTGDRMGSHWDKVWSGSSGAVNSIAHDTDSNVFVAVGANGLIIRSQDGGRSWNAVATPFTRSLVTVTHVDAAGSFVAVGGYGFMAASVDAGSTWSRILLPLNRTLRGLHISSTGNLTAVGLKGTIVVGNLRAQTLVRGSPYDFTAMVDTPTHGLFLYGPAGLIRQSSDGGQKWQNANLNTDSSINSLTECSGRLWAVGEHGLVATSTNGLAWTARKTKPDVSLNGIACSQDGRHVFIVGALGTVETSHDSGITWNTSVPTSNDNLNAVAASSNLVVAAGDSGKIIVAGLNASKWSDVSQDSMYNFSTIQIGRDSTHIWIFGSNGAVFFSHNAGRDWDNDDNSVTDDLHSSICLAACRIVAAVGDNGTVVIRGDSDEEWNYTTKSRFALRSITADAQGILYGLGEDATIYRPKDINGAWQTNELGAMQDAFTSADGKHIWAAGDNGTAWETDDGGVHWKTHDTKLHKTLNAIAGDDLAVNIVAVSDQGFCVRSNDQGRTWRTERISKSDINGIRWIGSQFWAVGDKGSIFKFDNVAQTWSQVASLGSSALTAIAGTQDGAQLWAVGGGGTVAQSTDAGKSWSTQTLGDTDFNSLTTYGVGHVNLTLVGNSGAIASSKDGGGKWETRASGVGNLYSVARSPRTQQLIAVGQAGKLLISDDNGETWNSRISGTDSDLRSVLSFDNGNQLYALGDLGSFEKYAIYAERTVPEITQLTHTLSRVSVSIKFSGAYLPKNPTFTARVRRVNELNRTEPIVVPTQIGPHSEIDDPWDITFDLAQLDPTPGESFDLEMCFRDASYQRCIPLRSITAIPIIDLHKNAKWIVPSGAIISSAAILQCLLLVEPLWILALYRKAFIYEAIGSSSVPGAKLIKTILQGTLLPWFAFQPRTLGAWVKQNRLALSSRAQRDLQSSIAVGGNGPYISLPIEVQDGGHLQLITEPSRETFLSFSKRPVTIEICGPGGIGKTTLMNQCAAWLAEDDKGDAERKAAVGVIVIEPYVGDLIPYISKKLTKITEEDVSDEFVRQLLRKGILVPVVDSVSELEDAMQAKLKGDLDTTVTGLVILTSREPVNLRSMERVLISPKPLNSGTLLHFITSVLASAPGDVNEFNSMEFQLDIGMRIARIMTTAGTEIPLTPLLAKLYVDRAIELMRAGRSLEDLPSSIAEAYFDFIRLLLRREPALDQVAALACIKKTGQLSLGVRFIPSPLGIRTLLDELRAVVADRSILVINTLVAAGVLEEKEMGLGKMISFSLDPVAEFCAAYAYTEELGFDLAAWKCFRDKVLSAGAPAGFCSALDLVIKSAAQKGICSTEVLSWFALS